MADVAKRQCYPYVMLDMLPHTKDEHTKVCSMVFPGKIMELYIIKP